MVARSFLPSLSKGKVSSWITQSRLNHAFAALPLRDHLSDHIGNLSSLFEICQRFKRRRTKVKLACIEIVVEVVVFLASSSNAQGSNENLADIFLCRNLFYICQYEGKKSGVRKTFRKELGWKLAQGFEALYFFPASQL